MKKTLVAFLLVAVMVIGLMIMTEPWMNDKEKEEIFTQLSNLRTKLQDKGYINITDLSMGMSDDYLIALKCRATFVRLGRILFS